MDYRLENSIAFKILEERKSYQHLGNIQKLIAEIEPFLNEIIVAFDNYTFHNVNHSERVLYYMCEIAGEETLKKLSDLELAMIIYSAYLHDVGMWVKPEEKELIKNHTQYKFYMEKNKGDEIEAFQEYIRTIHGIRAAVFLKNSDKLKDLFCTSKMMPANFSEEVGLICQSHMENLDWIDKNLKEDFSMGDKYNSKFIALLLRIADYIDFDAQRAPEFFRSYKSLPEISLAEWRKHSSVRNNEKIDSGRIYFDIEVDDYSLYCKLQETLTRMDNEIQSCVKYSKGFHNEKYRMKIEEHIKLNIITKGFKSERFNFSLEYEAITQLLMGENLYGDKAYGFREILQNSFDACNLMKAYYLKHNPVMSYNPEISIIFDNDDNVVRIKDNGTGMSDEIIKKFFFSVGKSYYRSDDFKKLGYEIYPTGTFGIGFLASFMLSDNITVISKYYENGNISSFSLNKESPYICYKEDTFVGGHGTEIILSKESFELVLDKEKMLDFISDNFYKLDAEVKIFDKVNEKTSLVAVAESLQLPEDSYDDISDYLSGVECQVSFDFMGSEFKVGKSFAEVCHRDCVALLVTEKEFRLVDRKEYSNFFSNKYSFFGSYETCFSVLHNLYQDKEISGLFIEDYIDLFYRHGFEVFNQNSPILEQDDYERESNEPDLDIPICIIWDNSMNSDYIELVLKKGRFSFLYDSDVIECKGFGDDSLSINYSMNQTAIERIGVVFGFLGGNDRICISEYNVEIYHRNVKLKDAKVNIPIVASLFYNISIIANILTDELSPSVNRTGLTEEQENALAYAIGKAVHFYALKLLPNDNIKEMFENFVEKQYHEDNKLCNSQMYNK